MDFIVHKNMPYRILFSVFITYIIIWHSGGDVPYAVLQKYNRQIYLVKDDLNKMYFNVDNKSSYFNDLPCIQNQTLLKLTKRLKLEIVSP